MAVYSSRVLKNTVLITVVDMVRIIVTVKYIVS